MSNAPIEHLEKLIKRFPASAPVLRVLLEEERAKLKNIQEKK